MHHAVSDFVVRIILLKHLISYSLMVLEPCGGPARVEKAKQYAVTNHKQESGLG